MEQSNVVAASQRNRPLYFFLMTGKHTLYTTAMLLTGSHSTTVIEQYGCTSSISGSYELLVKKKYW